MLLNAKKMPKIFKKYATEVLFFLLTFLLNYCIFLESVLQENDEIKKRANAYGPLAQLVRALGS